MLTFNVSAQLFSLDFDSDGCGGINTGCNFNGTFVEDGCIFLQNPNIPMYTLSGSNKLTNESCDTWIGSADYQVEFYSHRIPASTNRKLICQYYADIQEYDNHNWVTLGEQLGFFFEIPLGVAAKNYYYQVSFQLEEIVGYNCDNPTALGSSQIDLYHKYKEEPTDIGFELQNRFHNLDIRDNSIYLGYYNTFNKPVGVYDSPIYKFNMPYFSTNQSLSQIAFFVTSSLECNSNRSSNPLLWWPAGSLMDNIVIDCDQQNIVFDLNIQKLSLDQLTQCDNNQYRVEIITQCPNINYDLFPYWVEIRNTNGATIKTANGTGRYTYINLDDQPSGDYTFEIFYITNTGYNVDVSDYNPNPTKTIHHSSNEFIVGGFKEFLTPIYVPADIIITNGGHLRIGSFAYFNEDAKIIVEDGGKLEITTNGFLTSCANQWPGIRVRSGGTVNAHGTISNAMYGIWNDDAGSGIINSSGAKYIDNEVGIIARYAAIPTILNSQFIGGGTGVTVQFCSGGTTSNGVLFEGNIFSYQTYSGIYALSTPINVRNGNQFIGCDEGITMRNLFGYGSQSIIGGGGFSTANVFSYCSKGIYANASIQYVQNNIFTGCNNATWMSGLNNYESEFNSFSGGYNAEGLFGTGSDTNISEHNDYSGSTYSIRAFFDNNNYTFLANCFYSSGTDIEAYGTISGAQGNKILAASNCFTNGNYVKDLDCNTNYFLYFLPDSTVSFPSCLVPHTTGTYTIVYEASDMDINTCGSSLSNPPIGEYDYIKAMGCDSLRIHSYITSYRAQLKSLQNKATPLNVQERATVAWLTRHLRYLVNQWAWCLRQQGRYTALYTWYKDQEEKEYAIKAAEVKVWMQQYVDALTELEDIVDEYGMDASIKEAILLNIDHIRTDIPASTLTISQLNTLRNVAAMSDPYATYGRSLLYVLTGEQIEPNLPSNIVYRNIQNESIAPKEIYTVFPNPTSDRLNITIDNVQSSGKYRYELRDIMGGLWKSEAIQQNASVDLSSLPNGMVFIHIFKNDVIVDRSKIIITK